MQVRAAAAGGSLQGGLSLLPSECRKVFKGTFPTKKCGGEGAGREGGRERVSERVREEGREEGGSLLGEPLGKSAERDDVVAVVVQHARQQKLRTQSAVSGSSGASVHTYIYDKSNIYI